MQYLRQLSALIYLGLLLTACGEKKQTVVTQEALLPAMSEADGKAIKEKEISFWEYSKNKQLDKVRAILANDYTAYFPNAVLPPTSVLNQLRNVNFVSYNMSNINVKPVSSDVAIITYDLFQDVTASTGEKWPARVKASSVYAKRGGQWYSVFYQEMPAQ